MIIRIINGSVNILYGKSASSYEDTDSTHVELSNVCMASEQKKGLLLSEITVGCGEKNMQIKHIHVWIWTLSQLYICVATGSRLSPCDHFHC